MFSLTKVFVNELYSRFEPDMFSSQAKPAEQHTVPLQLAFCLAVVTWLIQKHLFFSAAQES